MRIAVTKWTARRVGSGITIEGVDVETGRPVKVTNVAVILSASPFPLASGYVRGLDGEQDVTLRP